MKPTPKMIEAAREVPIRGYLTESEARNVLTAALAHASPPEVTEEALEAAVNAYHDDIRTSMRAAIEAADRVRFGEKPKVRRFWTVVWLLQSGLPEVAVYDAEKPATSFAASAGGQVLGPVEFPKSKG